MTFQIFKWHFSYIYKTGIAIFTCWYNNIKKKSYLIFSDLEIIVTFVGMDTKKDSDKKIITVHRILCRYTD